MTSSNGNIFRVTGPLCGEFTGPGEFRTQRPVTRSFDVFFDLRLNKPLSKQSWGWWSETLSRSLWRHRNECLIYLLVCWKVCFNFDQILIDFRAYDIRRERRDMLAAYLEAQRKEQKEEIESPFSGGESCQWMIKFDVSYLMMTSSNGNISRVTGLWCGEFTDHQWIHLTKASGAELWCFLWSSPK